MSEDKEVDNRYAELLGLFRGDWHEHEFRDIIRKLNKSDLDKKILLEIVGGRIGRVQKAASIVLVHFFLTDLSQKELFMVLDECNWSFTEGKVKTLIRNIDVSHYEKKVIINKAQSAFKTQGKDLAEEILKKIEYAEYQEKVKKVVTSFREWHSARVVA